MNKNISLISFYDCEYALNDFPDDEIRHGIFYLHVVSPHAKQKQFLYDTSRTLSNNTYTLVQMHSANSVRILGSDMLKHWK